MSNPSRLITLNCKNMSKLNYSRIYNKNLNFISKTCIDCLKSYYQNLINQMYIKMYEI